MGFSLPIIKKMTSQTKVQFDKANKKNVIEYSEDIYPYATFQLNQTSAGGETRCTSGAPMRDSEDLDDLDRERERGTPLQTFLYHDPLLTTAETLQLREVRMKRTKFLGIL